MAREDFIKQIECSKEFQILERLGLHPDATAKDTVQQILDLAVAALDKEGPAELYGVGTIDYNVSLALLELAQRLGPAKHGKLVEFVSLLQKEIVINPSTGEPLQTQGDVLFADLPSLGYTELTTWYEFGGDYRGNPSDPKTKPKERERWVKLNAFIAQLSQAADIRYPPSGETFDMHCMDKSLHAIWTMQFALEHEMHTPEALVDTAAMEAACVWFIYAADRLWANVQHSRMYDVSAGAGSNRFKERGWNGYTRERWELWHECLQDAKGACTDERMGNLLEDALAHMRRAAS
ncbi:hypothetical protein BDV23DRAFT_175564 [Aspergillus alliaceus]|uniref:Uncharacterized protein n=1 Tax=Petromyces alliaceus TaxID=209559 RepID=A0A5N7BWU7_PETAA|nr:hypothetical protein BDV23DRAFT_175564 [Aspergillus alliaceus]